VQRCPAAEGVAGRPECSGSPRRTRLSTSLLVLITDRYLFLFPGRAVIEFEHAFLVFCLFVHQSGVTNSVRKSGLFSFWFIIFLLKKWFCLLKDRTILSLFSYLIQPSPGHSSPHGRSIGSSVGRNGTIREIRFSACCTRIVGSALTYFAPGPSGPALILSVSENWSLFERSAGGQATVILE